MLKKLVYISDDDDNDLEENSKHSNSTSFIYSKISKLGNFRDKLENRDKYVKDKISQLNNNFKVSDFENYNNNNDKKKKKKNDDNDDDDDIQICEPEVINLSDSEESNDVLIYKSSKRKLRSSKCCSSVKKPNLTQSHCPIVDDVTEKLFQKMDEIDMKFKQSLHEDLSYKIAINNKEQDVDDEASYEKYIDSRPMRIKIKRLDKVEHFPLMRVEPISKILDQISQRFNIPVPKIILYLNDNIVDAKATPKSLNLSVADIFELLCRYEPTSASSSSETSAVTKNDDPNFIQLFLRDGGKKRLSICINRFELVRRLTEFYSKEKNIDVEKISLEFDSDKMSLESKIDSYDMEDEDQIDVIIKS